MNHNPFLWGHLRSLHNDCIQHCNWDGMFHCTTIVNVSHCKPALLLQRAKCYWMCGSLDHMKNFQLLEFRSFHKIFYNFLLGLLVIFLKEYMRFKVSNWLKWICTARKGFGITYKRILWLYDVENTLRNDKVIFHHFKSPKLEKALPWWILTAP